MDSQKVILVLGAGRSSSSLIAHLLGQSEGEGWEIHVGDLDLSAAVSKVKGHPRGHAFQMSASDATDRDTRIAASALVISMLPALMHPEGARVAIEAGVHVLTPSYVSDDMQALDARAKAQGVLVLNEMGLDPGIDHMSAMQVIDDIREAGGTMVSFASYCGGLVAPASDDNPWHYKLSWNPRNVVLAGQGGAATFLDRGRVRMVPPHKTFQALTPVEVGGRKYDGYPNRDSLGYRELYGLQGIQSLVRGTLRGEGFCQAWDVLVQLGMVRDDASLEWPSGTTWAGWTRTFLPADLDGVGTVREAVAHATEAEAEALDKLAWLGLFDEVKGPASLEGTPAQIVEALVTDRWVLGANDRDMIVMWHKFEYDLEGERKAKTSSLSLEGKDSTFTAMSDTVGLPMALAVKPMLEDTFGTTGVDVPMSKTYYAPLLAGLAELGIVFEEREIEA